MVERIMLFKLHDPEHRADLAKSVHTVLIGLEGLEEVSVGLPADAASLKSWDMSIVLCFASEAVQNIVLSGESFRALMDGELAPNSQVIKAWSFERLT